MFSTVDAHANRILRTYLVTPEGEALALLGTFSPPQLRVTAMPDTRTLEQVAREAAATKWAVFSFEQSLDALSSLPEDLRSYLARSPAMQRKGEALRRARALARDGGGAEVPPDSMLLAAADTAALDSIPDGYPKLIAFAQPGSTVQDGSEVLQVRIEVWGMRYDQQEKRIAPELLNSVTLDVE